MSAQQRRQCCSLLTPAAHLYAEMMALQDEMEMPIGYVLKWRGFRVPKTYLVNPAGVRRMLRFGHIMLPLLKRRARILNEKEPRAPFDPSFYEFEPTEALAVNG